MSLWKRLKSVFVGPPSKPPLSPFEQEIQTWWSSLSIRQQVRHMTKEERESWLKVNLNRGDGLTSSRIKVECRQISAYGVSDWCLCGMDDPLEGARRIPVSESTLRAAYANAHPPPPPPPPPVPTPESIIAEVSKQYGPSGADETVEAMLEKYRDPRVPRSMSFETFLRLYRQGDEARDRHSLRCPNCRKSTKFPCRLDLEYETRRGGRQFIPPPITVSEVLTSEFIPGEALCARCHEAVDCHDINVVLVNKFVAHYITALPEEL